VPKPTVERLNLRYGDSMPYEPDCLDEHTFIELIWLAKS